LGSRKGIRPVKTEWWGAGMVICLERGANLHIAQLMPLTLASVKFRLVLPFWSREPMSKEREYLTMYPVYSPLRVV